MLESEVNMVAVYGGVTVRGKGHVIIRKFYSHAIGWYKELPYWLK